MEIRPGGCEMNETPQAASRTHELRYIPLDKIHKSPHQMRRRFDEESIRELADSLRSKGLLQPVTVRQIGTAFELIAGERRLRAATLLGWETIPSLILSESSDEDAAILGLIENLQRVDLNPIEEARGYKQLTDAPYNMTQDAVAAKVGKQKSTICRALALLDLPAEIQAMLPRGNISESHTRFLRQITTRSQQVALAKRAEQQGWSVKETERQVQNLLGVAKLPAAGKKNQAAFRFTRRGDGLKIQATLRLQGASLDLALAQLKKEIEIFLETHQAPRPTR